ncbi:MAG TPA: zinc ribbon domain-containing protein, partial [Pirellulaceae bacterium]
MPIYEYACAQCGAAFELLMRGQEQPACPNCGESNLERQWSVPAAHVAGASLPIRESPRHGGCGLPACGTGC